MHCTCFQLWAQSSLTLSRLKVLLDVLSHVSDLGKRFCSQMADVRLDSSMHSHMIEKVPGSQELFAALWISSSIHNNHFSVLRVPPELLRVIVVLQLVEVFEVGFTSLILHNIPIMAHESIHQPKQTNYRKKMQPNYRLPCSECRPNREFLTCLSFG